MSLVEPTFSADNAAGFKQFKEAVTKDGQLSNDELLKNKYEKSRYQPSDDEKEMRSRIIRDFQTGVLNMWSPRVEFNDLAVIQRMMVDQLAWNVYQNNNGESASADDVRGWHSNAMRPVVRNKCISIAAHATARLIFPKVFAQNEGSEDDRDAAQVMEDLMEWAADKSNYAKTALYRTITALTDPVSIGYTEYAEVYRRVKTEKVNGKWQYKTMLDETLSGFQDVVVPTDELYIENFYEQDIQKQGFLIWRRVIPYSLAKAKYGSLYPKFNEHVRPGVQTVYSDANTSFYYVYDPNLRQHDVEELIYWNKALDVKVIMVNGVMLTDADNPNPRLDKQYPFDKFGYEIINNRCFYYKSLAFKLMQDANIVNTLYPMIIDGTYLSIMQPMVNVGPEAVSSDVIVPGAITTFKDPNQQLKPLMTSMNLKDGFVTLDTVERSLNDSSQDTMQQGQKPTTASTAYEISRIEQNAATVLGLFIQMIAQHVRDYGKLRINDILQYLTIADISKIADNTELVYKTFALYDKQSGGKIKNRRIVFDGQASSEPMDETTYLDKSIETLNEEGGLDANLELHKVNPELFRALRYMASVSPDILNPRSENLERAYDLETYDRAIANPLADQEENLRLLYATNPKTKRDPDKYIRKPQDMQVGQTQPLQQPGGSPLQAMAKASSALPQSLSTAPIA